MNGLYKDGADNNTISILDMEIPVIEYKGERVITFKIMDRLHKRPDGTAGRNFRQNRSRFEEGKHYFEVSVNDFRDLWEDFGLSKFASKAYLLTELGYLNTIRSFRSNVGITRKILRQYFGNTASPSVIVAKSYESEFGKILKDSLRGIASVKEQVTISGYRVDFLLPKYRIVLEYDEEQHMILSHRQKDEIRDNILTSLGYMVIHVRKTEPIGEGLNKILSALWKMKKYQ